MYSLDIIVRKNGLLDANLLAFEQRFKSSLVNLIGFDNSKHSSGIQLTVVMIKMWCSLSLARQSVLNKNLIQIKINNLNEHEKCFYGNFLTVKLIEFIICETFDTNK